VDEYYCSLLVNSEQMKTLARSHMTCSLCRLPDATIELCFQCVVRAEAQFTGYLVLRELISITGLALFKGSNWVGVWGLERIQFPKHWVFHFLEHQMTSKVKNPSNSEYYTPSTQRFRIFLLLCLPTNALHFLHNVNALIQIQNEFLLPIYFCLLCDNHG
jgi:hypothetical protein